MRTIKQAAEHSGISESLIRAVCRQIGDKDSLRDVCRGGADAGFAGFTYYSDTVAFFKRQRSAIADFAENMASDMGEGDAVKLVSGFNCFRGSQPGELTASIARCLYGGRLREEDTQVANALAWFALEEVARAVADE